MTRDDGCGINRQKLVEKFLEKNRDLKEHNLSDQEVLQLVFLDDFSTRDEVGEFSGRGVGMSALKSSIEELDGSIEIESIETKGTSFYMIIPQKNKEH